ncbi:MAG TPA: replicative DNA helicase [Kiritimatiellia bacterium]|mgnify:CR=1 FL=1|nr:replicative DNA helicase [Kiritimatiellia bacterium]HMP35153.1 replicative DNA helicase [Kiritimatiellia bacterium]
MAERAESSGTVLRTDRIPPHSEEAECGILGSILVEAERVIDLAIERQISPASFYNPQHRVLFEQMLGLREQNKPIDLITLVDRLGALQLLDKVGGIPALQSIIDSTPTAAHVEYYIDIVRDKYLLRTVIDKSREAIDECYRQEKDADFLLDQVEQTFYDIANDRPQKIPPWNLLIKESMRKIDQAIQEKREITGVPTGFTDLDKATSGLQPGDMFIIAARPSMGKTSLAMNIVEHVATGNNALRVKLPVAVFSLEMSTESLVKRMLCSRARISMKNLSEGYVSREKHDHLVRAADELSAARIFVDDTPGLEPIELRARARRLKKNEDIQLIVIDYLQMMNYSKFAREGRQREVAGISNALKGMAKELSVPVVVLSQLSRAPENRDGKPKLSDLRDSGSIEQDADVVGLLRRPNRYADEDNREDPSLAILDIAKQRNGPTGEIKLTFVDDITRFENRAASSRDESHD